MQPVQPDPPPERADSDALEQLVHAEREPELELRLPARLRRP